MVLVPIKEDEADSDFSLKSAMSLKRIPCEKMARTILHKECHATMSDRNRPQLERAFINN